MPLCDLSGAGYSPTPTPRPPGGGGKVQRQRNVFIRNNRGDSGMTALGEFISLPVGVVGFWHTRGEKKLIKSFISILFKHSMLLLFSVVTRRVHSVKNTISCIHCKVQAHV